MPSSRNLAPTRIGVIRNPRSGRSRHDRSWSAIESRLRLLFPASDLRIKATTAPGGAIEQAREMVSAGCTLVIAAGGDGTVTDVMQGVLGSEAALGILPLGTGNDLARSLGVGPKPDSALAALSIGGARRIDVAKWTQGVHSGHFVNVAGTGFDAAVADRVNRGIRLLSGTSAYLAGTALTLLRYRARVFRFTCDGEQIETRAMLVAIANAKSYGGGMIVAPQADLQDGLLDLVVVGEMPRAEFLRSFPRVFKGKHLAHPKVRTYRFKKLRVESEPQALVLADGELLGGGAFEVEVVPKGLLVVVGAGFAGGQ